MACARARYEALKIIHHAMVLRRLDIWLQAAPFACRWFSKHALPAGFLKGTTGKQRVCIYLVSLILKQPIACLRFAAKPLAVSSHCKLAAKGTRDPR
jgi:hypothetical protein